MTDRFSRKDITGMKRWKLTAIEDVGEDKHGKRLWRFKCDCGGECVTTAAHFLGDHTKSCGCLRRQILTDFKFIRTKHGKSRTPLYNVWYNMMYRCGFIGKPRKRDARCYVDRGITVCEEWRVFENFEKWALANGYAEGLELDRRDVNGSYCPENCHFVTHKANMRNLRRSYKLPSGEHIYDFCERWINRPLTKKEYDKIKNCWRAHKRLPDFIFEAMRKRAIADLDAVHK